MIRNLALVLLIPYLAIEFELLDQTYGAVELSYSLNLISVMAIYVEQNQ
jgi:hypothetical protein